MKFHSIGFVVAALTVNVFAQTPPATTTAPLATHNCARPPMPDASKKIAAAEANAFVRTLETFRNCVQAFSDSQKQIATAKQKEAEALKLAAIEAGLAAAAAASASNVAAKDYNTFSEAAVKIITPKDDAAPRPSEPPAPRPQRGY